MKRTIRVTEIIDTPITDRKKMLNVHPLKAIRRIDLRFGPMNDVKRQDRKPSMLESFETKSREADEFLVEAGAVC